MESMPQISREKVARAKIKESYADCSRPSNQRVCFLAREEFCR